MSDSSPPVKFRKKCAVAPPAQAVSPVSPKRLFKRSPKKQVKINVKKIRARAARRNGFLKSKFLDVQSKEETHDGQSVSGILPLPLSSFCIIRSCRV